eukprot:TRINITY_DN5368_c1_g1_i9.p1 TRINITY_DN5368_c1_g1~~TRINITY_DN5368_c1_g1_i9.p1  ORF type:complete len:935 (+),score=116.05 TRINITY_DN5368_c1_g1_i9:49-2853(+)
MLSLRGSSIGLSLVCVVASATLAAYLATVSGDTALSNTKQQRDGALRTCFSVSADNSRGQAAKLTSSLEHDATRFVRNFLSNAFKLAEAMTFEMHHSPSEHVWDWSRLESEVAPRLWSMVWRSRGMVTSAGIVTAKEQILWAFDAAMTREAARDQHHQIMVLQCNGTDYGATAGRLVNAEAEWGTGQLQGGSLRDPGTPCGGYDFCAFDSKLCNNTADWQPVCDADGHCCVCNRPCGEVNRFMDRQYNSSVRIGVDVPDYDGCQRPAWTVKEKCRVGSASRPWFDDDQVGALWLMGSRLVPHGQVLWTPIMPVHSHLGLIAIGNWAPPGTNASLTGPHNGTAGITIVGLDSRTVQAYLRDMRPDGNSRMLVVVKEGSIGEAVGLSSGGMLLAACGGPTFRAGEQLSAIKPEDSPDAVVSAVAKNISSGHWGGDGSGYAGFVERNGARTVEVAVNLTGASDAVLGDGDGVGPENARFFVRVTAEEVGSLGFWFVTAFDYNALLGELERTSEATQREVDERNEQVSDDLAHDRTALFLILASVAVGLCLVAVASTFAIVAPLRKLGFEMVEVSRMNLDGMSQDLSFLSEIAKCQTAFIVMAKALAEYREFLPQSVLDDRAASVTEQSPRTSWASANRSPRLRGRSTVEESEGSQCSESGGPRRVNARGLQRRKCSIAAIGVHRWHLVLEEPEASVLAVISNFVQGMMRDAEAAKGVCDNFSGDRVMVSFNALRPVSTHRAAAVEFGVASKAPFPSGGCTWWTGHADCHVTIALVAGELWCGNAGPPGMVRSCVLGPVMSWGHVLQRHMQQHRGWQRTATFADRSIAATVSTHADMRLVSLITFAKRGPGPIQILELTGVTGSIDALETQFQLTDVDGESRWRQWNDTVGRMLSSPTAIWDGQLLASLRDDGLHDVYLEYLLEHAAGQPVVEDLSGS